jgi:hypothetical protein
VQTEKEASPFKTGTDQIGTPGGNAPTLQSLLRKVADVKSSRNNYERSSRTTEPPNQMESDRQGTTTSEENIPQTSVKVKGQFSDWELPTGERGAFFDSQDEK